MGLPHRQEPNKTRKKYGEVLFALHFTIYDPRDEGQGEDFIAVTDISAITTVFVIFNPHARFAYGYPELQGAFDTAGSLIAAFGTVLAIARLQWRRGTPDLMLASTLSLIALSDAFFATIPALTGLSGSNAAAWPEVVSRSLGSLLFGVAAFVPVRPIRRTARARAAAATGVLGCLTLTFILTWIAAGSAPTAVIVAPSAVTAVRPGLRGGHLGGGLEMTAAVLSALAVFGYLRRSRRYADRLSGWLAIAAVIAVAAHVSYLLYPPSHARVVSAGDAFQLCFYVVLLIGAMRETRSYWIALSDARVASERRRIACDLHDGLAQEIAYLGRNLDALHGHVGEEILGRLRMATERARLESRMAVRRLTVTVEPATGEAVAEAVGEVAKRFGLDLELDLAPGLRLPITQTDALVRIACEAVVNAARHSGSGTVAVSLQSEGAHIRMLVRDQGCGFDPAASGAGFGLTSMRERARSAGATLAVSSEPGGGSQVEVEL